MVSHVIKQKGYMKSLSKNELNPLIYLLAGSELEKQVFKNMS